MSTERVECDRCGKRVTLKIDGTVSEHGWTRRGVFHHCDDSGKRYAWHMGSFFVAANQGRPWVAQCRCGAIWTGPDYKVVEQQWEQHAGTSTERAS